MNTAVDFDFTEKFANKDDKESDDAVSCIPRSQNPTAAVSCTPWSQNPTAAESESVSI